MTTAELRQLIEIPETVTFWGITETITPLLVEEVFGNGKKLLVLSPLMHRPNYFIVRVDDSWDCGDMADGDEIQSHIEAIMRSCEDQYGEPYDYDDEHGNELEEREYNPQFPRVDWGEGCCWNTCDWPVIA